MKELEKLKDIKDIVPIEDYSLYILIAIIFFALFLILLITYFLKRNKIKSKPTKKELAYKRLKQLNLDNDDAKKVIYTISLDGVIFLNDDNQYIYNQIQKKSMEYKYKKNVKQLNNSIKKLIKQYINSIKVGNKDGK